MSLYVLPENQELLWNVISKNIYIRDFFAPYNAEKKNEWFKMIIRTFYDKYKNRHLTVNDLNNVNKETISYMIQNVREQMNQPVAKTSSPDNKTPSYQPVNSYSITTPPIVADTRQEVYAKEFEQRQIEYENLKKKTVPENVDFTEKAEDGVIQNMDELIKIQMEQRAYERSLIPPPTSKPTHPIEMAIVEETPVANLNHMVKDNNEMQKLRTTIETLTAELVTLKTSVEASQTGIADLNLCYQELLEKYNVLLLRNTTSSEHDIQSTVSDIISKIEQNIYTDEHLSSHTECAS